MLDPRTPVLVGVGQVTNRPDASQPVATRPHPFALMADACRLAAADAAGSRAHRLLARAGSLAVVGGLGWQLANPARWVAGELGIAPADLAVSAIGGNMPLTLLHRAAGMIGRGELDVAVVCGAECFFTRRALGAREALGADGAPAEPAGWPRQAPGETLVAHLVGRNRPPVTPAELACGVRLPVDAYPLLEHSLRAARGWSPARHRARMGARWARFSDVAAENPYAWLPERHSPDEIVEPGPHNRMVASPYTKLCTANIFVDQSAALVCCSVRAAKDAGVPEDRWVFPLGGAEAHDHWFLSERVALHRSPAMEIAGARALRLAGVRVDDLGPVDLYSCFPVVVEMAAAALGLDAEETSPQPLTVTGGLTFFGGPGNNYVTHGVASLADRLRAAPSTVGLASGLGWYATKHAFGVFASRPPAHDGAPFRCDDVQRDVDALPHQVVDDDATGTVVVETYTVAYDRETRPHRGIAACRTPEGARTWAAVVHPDSLAALAERDTDAVGTAGVLGADRQLTFG